MKLTVDFSELWAKASQMAEPGVDTSLEGAYEAGRDSVLNGSSTRNSHYAYFATPELKQSWESGRASVATVSTDKN